jgi:DNA-binding CsgD family transcriptional regulator
LDILDLSTVPGHTENFERFIEQLCHRLGVEYGSYGTVNPMTGLAQGYATYKQEWKEHYVQHNLQQTDPTIHRAALSIAPVDWSRFERDARFHSVFRSAHDFGISAQGISVPIRGPYGDRGLLSVTAGIPERDWVRHSRQIVGELQVAAVHLHDAVMRSGHLMPALARPVLSTREREVLQWVAAGKSQQDIGDILSISHRTVEVHLRSAREKLGALTTIQAVGRAVGYGIIVPR